ncbi:recombinase family protein, partial [Paracoccus sediminilitoris]|uniref:recombinase family protein n=1 Tax=Paracoccus sediminilitoris TaxID=2202419 RepID=UPI002F425A5C
MITIRTRRKRPERLWKSVELPRDFSVTVDWAGYGMPERRASQIVDADCWIVRYQAGSMPLEADIIRRVFRDFADGRSPKAITQRLNKEGIPGPRGQLWRSLR